MSPQKRQSDIFHKFFVVFLFMLSKGCSACPPYFAAVPFANNEIKAGMPVP